MAHLLKYPRSALALADRLIAPNSPLKTLMSTLLELCVDHIEIVRPHVEHCQGVSQCEGCAYAAETAQNFRRNHTSVKLRPQENVAGHYHHSWRLIFSYIHSKGNGVDQEPKRLHPLTTLPVTLVLLATQSESVYEFNNLVLTDMDIL